MFERTIKNTHTFRKFAAEVTEELDYRTNLINIKNKENEDLRVALQEKSKKITDLFLENTALKKTVEVLEVEKKSPRKVVEAVMAKKIEWYNYQDLAPSDRFQYYQNAQSILNNPVFLNEKNYLISCWAKWCLEHAHDFEGVKDMRMSVNGITLLEERLGEIESPHDSYSMEDLTAAL